MEIGVYNGENAVSMIKVALKNYPPDHVEYFGFDFFYYYTKKSIADKLDNLGCKYKLIQGDTLDTVPKAVDTLPMMDLVFIDGGKSYEEACSDWNGASKLMHQDTSVFVHNVGFTGVNKMLQEISRDRYVVEFFSAHYEGRVAKIMRKE